MKHVIHIVLKTGPDRPVQPETGVLSGSVLQKNRKFKKSSQKPEINGSTVKTANRHGWIGYGPVLGFPKLTVLKPKTTKSQSQSQSHSHSLSLSSVLISISGIHGLTQTKGLRFWRRRRQDRHWRGWNQHWKEESNAGVSLGDVHWSHFSTWLWRWRTNDDLRGERSLILAQCVCERERERRWRCKAVQKMNKRL
jgi:hypothetical protein